MNKRILHSVINITGQRDVDSLDYGLVHTFTELLPLRAVSLYKLIGENPEDGIEKAIYAFFSINGEIQIRWKQSNEMNIIKDNQNLNKCLFNKLPLSYKTSLEGNTHLIIPLICEEKVIGAIEVEATKDLKNFKELINSITRIYENYYYILNISERDKLTGLLNRRCFETKFNRLLQLQHNEKHLNSLNQIENERRELSNDSYAWLVMIDIDYFKKINDTFGHVCGDEVLLKFSQIMKAFFRNSDLLFRFGGEEFIIILEPIPREMAEHMLEIFRNKVANSNFPLIEKITISGGYVRIYDLDYSVNYIDHADQALYYAKNKGRNCIYNYELLVEKGELLSQFKNGEVEIF